jgi:thymidylate synthase ThyX
MKLIRRKDLNIEDIRSEDYWNRLRIFSILNTENFSNKLEINALIEECITSKNTALSICKSFKSKNYKRSPKDNYYNLNYRTYLVENLPILTYLKIANEFTYSSVKNRNLKYIDRDTTFFVRIPKEIAEDVSIRKEYEQIQFKSIGNYRELYTSKLKKSKEYSQLLLPLGIQNRAFLSLTLKDNIQLANMLLCSDSVLENQLGDMFESILNPEIKIEPNSQKRSVMNETISYLMELVSEKQKFNETQLGNFEFKYVTDIVENFITNLERLINPLGSADELEFDYNDQVNIGKLVKQTDLGNIAKSKGSILTGYLSVIEILKLLEYRYLLYIPLLSDFININKELERNNSKCYLLPNDIDNDIKKELQKKLNDIYDDIKKWNKKSRKYMSEEMALEFTRYLLPLAHATRFNLYLDINDIFDIRNKDLEYKEEWMKLFYQKDPIFKK